ncbi:MAG: type ISP restriction/modification enzyme [Candidatus Latescibacterota bacterium]
MDLNLKPSHKAVKDYYAALQKFTSLGYEHEGAVKNAFAKLLRTAAKQFGYTLIEEYPFRKNGRQLSIDGTLIDDFKLAQGYWEAKDTKDDLDAEIKKKFETGYPRDNILFQSPDRIVLFQNGERIFDKQADTPESLIEPLHLFFSYHPPEFEHWKQAVDEFSGKVRQIAEGLLLLIEQERNTNTAFVAAYAGFIDLCRRSINPNISDKAIEEMLIQHLLTIRIFSKIFNNPDFATKNIIAHEIEKVIDALTSHHFSRGEFLKELDPFYVAIERAAATIDDYTRKQDFLNTVYEKFFQGFSVKVADTHGIVYTPQPIVDFMVNSVEDILQREFGRSLSDEGVHILDPFVGTGNFIMRIMRQIRKTALPDKYDSELHCNEVMLLPYYIASMNIEHAYFEMTGEYKPFEGICLVDTFGLAEPEQLDLFTEKNTERVERQKKSPIFVIIGNPPYNAGQVNENDNNKNRKYPVINKRIKDTYIKDSLATLHTQLYDPYVKAIRWASDRIREKNDEGIVAFVSNNSFIDSISYDGVRKHLMKDFKTIYILDLGGNVRKNPKLSGTTHNVFGIQVGVSINFFVRKNGATDTRNGRVYYARVDEYWRKEQKYTFLNEKNKSINVLWKELLPDKKYNWLTDDIKDDFETFLSMGKCDSKRLKDFDTHTFFTTISNGVKTNRDTWVYNFSVSALESNIKKMITVYNDHISRWHGSPHNQNVDDFVDNNENEIKWSGDLKTSSHKRKKS